MEEQLSEDQINECRETFKMFDKDGDGTITCKELGIVMRQLGLNPTEDELLEMIQEVDEDGNGEISFTEFLTIMAHKMKDADTELGTLEAFRVFDRERTGFITKSELKNILMNLGETMQEEEADELLQEAEVNIDGNVDYLSFVKGLTKKSSIQLQSSHKLNLIQPEKVKQPNNHYFIDLSQPQKQTCESSKNFHRLEGDNRANTKSVASMKSFQHERLDVHDSQTAKFIGLKEISIADQNMSLEQRRISGSGSGYTSPQSELNNSRSNLRSLFNMRNLFTNKNDLCRRNAQIQNMLSKSFTQSKQNIEVQLQNESSHFNEHLQQTYAKLNQFEREWSSSKLQKSNSQARRESQLGLLSQKILPRSIRFLNQNSKSPSPLNLSRNDDVHLDLRELNNQLISNTNGDIPLCKNKYEKVAYLTSSNRQINHKLQLHLGRNFRNFEMSPSPQNNSSLLYQANNVGNLTQNFELGERNYTGKMVNTKGSSGQNFFNLQKQQVDSFQKIKTQYQHISQTNSKTNLQDLSDQAKVKGEVRQDLKAKYNDILTDRLKAIQQILQSNKTEQRNSIDNINTQPLNNFNEKERNAVTPSSHMSILAKLKENIEILGRNCQGAKINESSFAKRRVSENPLRGVKSPPFFMTKCSKIDLQNSMVKIKDRNESTLIDINTSSQIQQSPHQAGPILISNTYAREPKSTEMKRKSKEGQTPLGAIQRKVINLNPKGQTTKSRQSQHMLNISSNSQNFVKMTQPLSHIETPKALESTTQSSSLAITQRTMKSEDSHRQTDSLENRINSLLKETKSKIQKKMSNTNVNQSQRAYHSMQGSQKKKAIDSSLDELKKKFTQQNPQYVAHQKAKQEQQVAHQEQKQQQQRKQSSSSQQSSSLNLGNPILQTKISQIIADNAQYLFSQITNLYVGNLSPEVTEELLLRTFSKYGEVESVKVMWPRTEEEKKRKRNCGFIKFCKYESAYLAKEALNEQSICGQSMKINWGKGISQTLKGQGLLQDYSGVNNDGDLEMQYIENQLNLVIMNMPILDEQDILNQDQRFYDASIERIHVKIPEDAKTRVIIDKFAKLVTQNGNQIEDEVKSLVLQGQSFSNDILKSLFDNSNSDLQNYYQWRTYSYYNGDSARSWSQHPFQIYQNGPVWIPPQNPNDANRLNPARVIKEQMQKQTQLVQNALSHLVKDKGDQEGEEIQQMEVDEKARNDIKDEDDDDEYDKQKESQNQGMIPLTKEEKNSLIGILDKLTSKKQDICEGMIVAMEYAQNSREVADTIFQNLLGDMQKTANEINLSQIYAKLYLISDILFNSQNPQITTAWSYRREFELKMGVLIEKFNVLWSKQIEGKLSQKQLKKVVMRMLKIWKENSIYEEKEIDGWEATLKISKENYYAYNLKEGFFQPPNIKDKKLLEKLKQIVVPELKRYYRRLEENKNNLERECKLNGLPLNVPNETKEDIILRLIALEEYKIKKILKERLSIESRQEEDEGCNKDQFMMSVLRNNLRKPITFYDNTVNEEDLLNEPQRRSILEKAIQDIIQENAKLRNIQPKIQQSYLQIDEGQIDGRNIHESEYQLLEIDKNLCEKNKRLIQIANKTLAKGEIDIDNLSIDSDELMVIQEDTKDDEDIDGIELSDNDEIFQKNTQKEEYFSAVITSEHFKKIMKYARQKRLLANNQAKRQLQTQNSQTPQDQDILVAQEQLDKYKLEFNRMQEKLEEDSEQLERVLRLKRRLERELEENNEHNQKNYPKQMSNSEIQLRQLRKKVDMYRQLNERIKSENVAKKTKNIYQQSSKHQETERKRSRSKDRSRERARSHERMQRRKHSKSRSRSLGNDRNSHREKQHHSHHHSNPKKSVSVSSKSSSSSISFILDEEKKDDKRSIFERITKKIESSNVKQIELKKSQDQRYSSSNDQRQVSRDDNRHSGHHSRGRSSHHSDSSYNNQVNKNKEEQVHHYNKLSHRDSSDHKQQHRRESFSNRNEKESQEHESSSRRLDPGSQHQRRNRFN